MRKPVIGILGNILTVEDGVFSGLERDYVNCNYVNALALAGAVPLLLPVVNDEEIICEQVKQIDGLLLSGGYDIAPLIYGEEPVRHLEFVHHDVDIHQIYAVKCAYAANIPIFGICRGIQVINVAFGGTLHQDVAQIPGSSVQHSQKAKMHAATHTVDIVPGTRIFEIFGRESLVTNSFHHQAVKVPPLDFIVSGQAKDGVVEAIEQIGELFVVGVQWNPEMMVVHYPEMLRLFQEFVCASSHKY